jgi:hypothetical protein
MSSESQRRVAKVAVFVLLLAAVAGFPGILKGMEPVEVQPVDIPIPKDTQGPFGMNMCLSPDGKQVAVAGNTTDRNYLWNPRSELFYKELRYARRVSVCQTFEKKVYAASSSPSSASDYSLLVENHRMSAILAMAISPREPYQLAYVSREIEHELPADPKKSIPIPPFTPDSKGFREVLYVVPLSRGTSKVVLTMEARSTQLYSGLHDTSLCWTDDATALVYGDLATVSRISLSGKKDVLYTFDRKHEQQSEHNHYLASNLACRPGGLVEFLDYGRDAYHDGKAWNEVFSMRLVRVDQDRKVVNETKWPQFPFFKPPLKRNPAFLSEDTWAYLYAGEEDRKAHLCVGSRSDPSKIVDYLLDLKHGKDRLRFALLGLSPDGSEAWLSQKVDFHGMSDADIERYVPAVPYSSLKLIRLRAIR